MKLQMIATCLFGLERQLGEEIDKLGGVRLQTIDGRITFEGDEPGEHMYVQLVEFPGRVCLMFGTDHAHG